MRCATHSELWRKTYENQWWIYIDKFWMLPSSRSNFLHFHAVFGEIWPKNRLAPPSPLVSAFSTGKSLIRPWEWIQHGTICKNPPLTTLEFAFVITKVMLTHCWRNTVPHIGALIGGRNVICVHVSLVLVLSRRTIYLKMFPVKLLKIRRWKSVKVW